MKEVRVNIQDDSVPTIGLVEELIEMFCLESDVRVATQEVIEAYHN